MQTSDPYFVVLHLLRLRGVADDPALAEAAAPSLRPDVADLVAKAEANGHAKRRTGRRQGWTLTQEGRAEHARLLADDRRGDEATDAVRSAYTTFLKVNQPFINLCSDWQVRTDTRLPNDHTDAEYDAGITARLGEIDDTQQQVTTRLATAMERFGGYGPRFAHALQRVRAGEGEWLTRPMIDSYHTVWFELHEDLLLTLDIERGAGR